MTPQGFTLPQDLEEALVALSDHGPEARVLAGGTALVPLLASAELRGQTLVSLARLPELRHIESSTAGLTIGATVTHSQAIASPHVSAHCAGLRAMFRSIGSPRIRNAGTVGGNLARCDPFFDVGVTLLALDASVTARRLGGERRIRLEDLMVASHVTSLEADELLTAIEIPPQEGCGLGILKFTPHARKELSLRLAAWVRTADGGEVTDVRVAVGAVLPVPVCVPGLPGLLRGRPLDDESLSEAGAATLRYLDAGPGPPLGDWTYKRRVLPALLRRVLEEASEDAGRPVSSHALRSSARAPCIE